MLRCMSYWAENAVIACKYIHGLEEIVLRTWEVQQKNDRMQDFLRLR